MSGDLSTNWEHWRLADVGEWLGGGTPSSSNAEFWDGEIPWVSPKDMKVKQIFSAQDRITAAAVQKSATKMISTGSVLFVTRSGILAHSFPVATTKVEVTVNQDLKAITPVEVVDHDYLAWVLRAYERQILNTCSKHGTTVHSIEIPALKDLRVPVPPPAEQRRIIAKIEELFSELDNGVESLTTAREQLKAYRQAVLKYAFEGKLTADRRAKNPAKLETPEFLLSRIRAEREARYVKALDDWQKAISQWRAAGEIGDRPARPRQPSDEQADEVDTLLRPQVPTCWTTAQLGTLDVEVFDGPFGSNLKTNDYVERGVRVVRLENIGHGRFIDEKRSFVSEEKYEHLKKHTVLPGDIVFSSFVTDAIRSAIVPKSIPFAVNKADCFGLRFFGNAIGSVFVQRFLESRNAFKQIEGMVHGVGRPRINTAQLKQVVVPVCSPDEQTAIVETLERVFSEIDFLDADILAQLDHLSTLRQSILKRAFSGQLVEHDPKDEPASVLLQRIRAEKENSRNRRKKNNKNNGKKEAA